MQRFKAYCIGLIHNFRSNSKWAGVILSAPFLAIDPKVYSTKWIYNTIYAIINIKSSQHDCIAAIYHLSCAIYTLFLLSLYSCLYLFDSLLHAFIYTSVLIFILVHVCMHSYRYMYILSFVYFFVSCLTFIFFFSRV